MKQSVLLYFCYVKATQNSTSERIILGIDPGTNVLGYGLLEIRGREAQMMAMGVIDLRRVTDVYLKLGRIYERIMGVIDAFHPDELAIEAPFFGKNVQSMLKLGRAQGVVIAAAIARHIPIHEYAPRQIKQAITGRGAASKEQVAALMQRLLCISEERMLPYLDATDALAAAYCHHLRTMSHGVKNEVVGVARQRCVGATGGTSWSEFVKTHAHRVHQ